MKPEYEPRDMSTKLAYLVEEAGEVMAAVGKSLRWGLDSTNPELKPEDPLFGETNAQWVLRELGDLEGACGRVRQAFRQRAQDGEK